MEDEKINGVKNETATGNAGSTDVNPNPNPDPNPKDDVKDDTKDVKDNKDKDTDTDAETFAQRKNRIIAAMKVAGGRTISATVIGCNVGDEHESGASSISFSLDRKVKTADKVGSTSILWDTTFGVFSQMKHDASLAMFMPIIVQHPRLLSFLLAGAKVQFLLQDVVAGEPFVNPFSELQKQSVTDKDRTLSWVTNISLSEQAKSLLQAILFGQVNVAQLEANISKSVPQKASSDAQNAPQVAPKPLF